jgi:HAD superfamily hydrolase (TIGR01509 family)
VITEPSVDVLLFDLGGVLIDFAGFAELPRLLRDPPSPAEMRQRWICSEAVRLFELGRIGPEEFADRFRSEWGLEMSGQEFLRRFTEWARGLYPGAAHIRGRLAAAHSIACLSNSNVLHTPLHRAAIGPYIERCFFSNELGLLKPDPAIFEHVIRALAVPPARIAFFDDTGVNVEAARRVGMSAYRVEGVAELERRLAQIGV